MADASFTKKERRKWFVYLRFLRNSAMAATATMAITADTDTYKTVLAAAVGASGVEGDGDIVDTTGVWVDAGVGCKVVVGSGEENAVPTVR
jgi:hypothetical protein